MQHLTIYAAETHLTSEITGAFVKVPLAQFDWSQTSREDREWYSRIVATQKREVRFLEYRSAQTGRRLGYLIVSPGIDICLSIPSVEPVPELGPETQVAADAYDHPADLTPSQKLKLIAKAESDGWLSDDEFEAIWTAERTIPATNKAVTKALIARLVAED